LGALFLSWKYVMTFSAASSVKTTKGKIWCQIKLIVAPVTAINPKTRNGTQVLTVPVQRPGTPVGAKSRDTETQDKNQHGTTQS
jgi:hypothetical protein